MKWKYNFKFIFLLAYIFILFLLLLHKGQPMHGYLRLLDVLYLFKGKLEINIIIIESTAH